MQDLANEIGSRILISPNSDFNTFAIGSTEPTTNAGPWFTDCEKWFHDALCQDTSLPKGGFDNIQAF